MTYSGPSFWLENCSWKFRFWFENNVSISIWIFSCSTDSQQTLEMKKNFMLLPRDFRAIPMRFPRYSPLLPRYSLAIHQLFPRYSLAIHHLFPAIPSLFPATPLLFPRPYLLDMYLTLYPKMKAWTTFIL